MKTHHLLTVNLNMKLECGSPHKNHLFKILHQSHKFILCQIHIDRSASVVIPSSYTVAGSLIDFQSVSNTRVRQLKSFINKNRSLIMSVEYHKHKHLEIFKVFLLISHIYIYISLQNTIKKIQFSQKYSNSVE